MSKNKKEIDDCNSSSNNNNNGNNPQTIKSMLRSNGILLVVSCFVFLRGVDIIMSTERNQWTTPTLFQAAKLVKTAVTVNTTHMNLNVNTTFDSSHCYFRTYPHPPVESGLPLIGDLFASHDASVVYIVAEGRKFCQVEYNHSAHDLFAYRDKPGAQFECIFETDGSTTRSLPMHGRIQHRLGAGVMLIQCPVPLHLQSTLPKPRSAETTSYLTLKRVDYLPQEDDSSPLQLLHLPICSHMWPTSTFDHVTDSATKISDKLNSKTEEPPLQGNVVDSNNSDSTHKSKKYRVSIMTRISLSYTRGSNMEQLSIRQLDFVTWMEYHLALGVEHFYIYDDSPSWKNSTLKQWCQPYWEEGVLTYVHYPYRDIECDWPGRPRPLMYMAQVISSNAALRRFQSETEWLGHWDIDEYLVLPPKINSTNMLHEYVDRLQLGPPRGKKGPPISAMVDEINFLRPIYGECQYDDTNYKENKTDELQLAMEQKQCFRMHKIPKSLFRTETVLAFRVHNAQILMDYGNDDNNSNNRTNNNHVKSREVPYRIGHIAHFQNGKKAGSEFPSPGYQAFRSWIPLLKERVQARTEALAFLEAT